MERKKDANEKKETTKRKTTNRISHKNVDKSVKEKKVVEEEKENTKRREKATTFNLVEVIIIMIITAVFGILVGSCVAYFKDNVIDHNSVPYEFQEFMDVYDDIKSDYYKDIDQKEMAEAGIKGMVDFLDDPYSSYLDYNDSTDLDEELKGEFVGMGATVTTNDKNEVYIMEIYKDSPGEKAGFQVGDIIKKVGDQNVVGMDMDKVSSLIKGDENTKVDITVLRNGEEKTLTLTRGVVELTSVCYRVIDGIGYVQVTVFAQNTPKQFKEVMEELKKQNVSSIIIDIRGNSGGYLQVAQEMAAMFLDKGTVVYQLDTKGKTENIKTTTDKLYDNEIAILVNYGSASASEIFASSLNENLGTPLVGDKTYGKGTVQKTKKLSSGAMIKYTVQEWYTSKGNRVDGLGIEPTEKVSLPESYYENPTDENDTQLQKALEILKK